MPNTAHRKKGRRNAAPRFRKLPTVILTAFVTVAIVVAAFAGYRYFLQDRVVTNTTSDTIELRFENIGELATQSGRFRNVQTIESAKMGLLFPSLKIPFTESRYIFSYDGVLKAGCNFEDISYTVDEDAKTIVITMPAARILSCEVDEGSLKVYDEKQNVYTPLTLEKMQEAREKIREEAEKEALANGFLEEAEANAKTLVKAFIAGYPKLEGYRISFAASDETGA